MPVPKTPDPVRSTRTTLSASAYEFLLVRIGDGSMAAGEQIDDVAVAAELGVSRGTVRQALNRLAELGLVDMAPNRFTRVAEPAPDRFAATIEVAVVLWRLGAALTLQHPFPAMRAEFQDLVDAVLADVAAADVVDGNVFIGQVIDVFEFFTAHSGNPVLVETAARLRPVIAHTARLGVAAYDLPGTAALMRELARSVAETDAASVDRALASVNGMATSFLERSAADA